MKFRLTAVVVLLVLAATALVAFASLKLAERQMQAIVGDQQYALLSSAAAYIDEDLHLKQTLLSALQEELAQRDDRSPGALQAFLEGHATLRDEFFNVIVLDASGAIVANLNDRRVVGTQNFSHRQYFRATVDLKEGVISSPFMSAISGKAVVLITEPIFDAKGKLTHILGGSIDLQRPHFFGQFESLRPGQSGYLFMLTLDGTIIHHPDKERILTSVSSEPGGPIPSTLAALKGFEGWVVGKSKRDFSAIMTYKRLHKTDWILGAEYPVAEAFAPLIEIRRNSLIASACVAAIAGLAGWLAIRILLLPLGALQRNVGHIFAGSKNIDVFDVMRKDEFGELSRAFFGLSKQRRDAEAELIALSRTDSLTGIYNRRMFEEVFSQARKRAMRSGKCLAVAYLDIDHFKSINDTYGHHVGDDVLKEFARRLRDAVRANDTVARLAGDEFVVIFEDLNESFDPAALAKKILDSIRPAFRIGEQVLDVTTSVGVAISRTSIASLDAFLMRADEALYEAKSSGRNNFSVRNLALLAPDPAPSLVVHAATRVPPI